MTVPVPVAARSIPEASCAVDVRTLDQASHLRDAGRRQAYVTAMFDEIAPRYDRFTRWFSYGMDGRWKRDLVEALAERLPPGAQCLDLACGTGDLAAALAVRVPGAHVEGIDASPRMVALAHRTHGARLAFEVGDMRSLPHADRSLDGIAIGYGLRNVPDLRVALAECARVLRPGGVLGSLDFARPVNAAWRAVFLGYLHAMGGAYGWWWHRHADVYRWIPRSIDAFVAWPELSRAIVDAGFAVEVQSPRLLGGVCLHVARRI